MLPPNFPRLRKQSQIGSGVRRSPSSPASRFALPDKAGLRRACSKEVTGNSMHPHDTPTLADENRALIIAFNKVIGISLQRILQQAKWKVELYQDPNKLYSMINNLPWTLVIIVCGSESAPLPEILPGLQPAIASERVSALVLAERPSTGDAMLCLQQGAMDYLAWPSAPTQVLEIAERARRLASYARDGRHGARISTREDLSDRRLPSDGRTMIGGSGAMLELSKQIVRVALSPDLRVFITGETGTGKEVVARQIHAVSGRTGPFLEVNCAATVESLLESDLFGHEKGAFTGAHATKKGLWEEAANGTLFLDEITETSPTVQAKLLRVLQEDAIRRVGSNHEIRVTARVVAASNKDVEKAVKEGAFRQDLYYRLGQVLRLPPLRERREDIQLLVDYFCERAAGGTVITPEAVEALCSYDWPGNVRELETVLQQIITFSGRFVFREDVLRHINVGQADGQKTLLPFWSAIHKLTAVFKCVRPGNGNDYTNPECLARLPMKMLQPTHPVILPASEA